MTLLRRGIPTALALIFGAATLVGLLLLPSLSDLILSWAAVLAAVALVLGVLNLLFVHVRRTLQGNLYSVLLVLSMFAVFGLAATDALGITENGVLTVFTGVQAPLEAALASLIAFFLLFAGVRLLQQQRNVWAGLFLLSALFFLLAQSPLPAELNELVRPVRTFISSVLVMAGTRGLLLGVALGTITLGLRLLLGLERPYSP